MCWQSQHWLRSDFDLVIPLFVTVTGILTWATFARNPPFLAPPTPLSTTPPKHTWYLSFLEHHHIFRPLKGIPKKWVNSPKKLSRDAGRTNRAKYQLWFFHQWNWKISWWDKKDVNDSSSNFFNFSVSWNRNYINLVQRGMDTFRNRGCPNSGKLSLYLWHWIILKLRWSGDLVWQWTWQNILFVSLM